MHIRSLHLKNFRNYKLVDIDFNKNVNVIYGNNAQGKTNILEAIFLCSSGRSHRTSRDMELIKIGEEIYSVKINFEKEKIDKCIEIIYSREEKKRIRINEIPLKKLGNLMGQLNTVMFSPEDILIIKEGPSERRRFIDIALSQLKPSYFYDLQQYVKILAQRNNLLREIEFKKSLIETLEIWDQSIAEKGSRIIKARKEFIDILSNKVMENHYKITNRNERLLIKYSSTIEGIKDYNNIQSIKDSYMANLEKVRKRELIKSTTLVGPQRDDYDFIINDASLKLYGSQGQQRTAILSIKLSEVDIVRDETGENPVLLLDDVMSELDNDRQEYLFNNLKDIQTFITCTEKGNFENRNEINTNFIRIKEGRVCQ